MSSPITQIFKRICILIFFIGSIIELQSQCNPPDQLPTVTCEQAPLTCLQDACYSTSNVASGGWNGFCGNQTAIHNPQYFEIIVEDPCIEVQIHVDDCDSGSALQAALVTHCDWQPCPGNTPPCPDVLDCDPGTGVGGTMTLSACGLTPGTSLWILIDGSSAAQCQYTITFADGIFQPLITEELTSASAVPSAVCQGFDDLLLQASPQIMNAHGYEWHLGWNDQIVTSTLPNMTLDIPDNAPPGIHEVCVFAFSGCDSTEQICFEVEIYEIDDIEKDPVTFCPEEFPIDWHSLTITGPGTYNETFDNEEGCPYDSIWTVDIYPDVPVGELNVVHCLNSDFDPYEYEGDFYSNSGTYPLDYPGMGLNGCDSTAELNLTLIGIDAFIEHTCENGEFILTVLVQEVVPGNADITYEWYVDGVLTYDNNPMPLLCMGTVVIEAIVTVSTAEGMCVYNLDPYTLNCDDEKPDPPVLDHGNILICAEEGVFFTVIEDPFGEPLTYTWTAPSDVYVVQDGSNEVEMDFSFSNGGQVCVFATGACGDGEPTCFEVEIIPSPVAAFDHELDVCNGTSTTITFTGSAGPNAVYVWDFDSPSSVTGTGVGPYNVTWNIDGDKVINLMVIEPGCDTAFATGIITVSNLLPPSLNCSSTLSSVTFDWDDVVGASGYLVTINNGSQVSTPTSEYMVSGLSPGATVTMILIIDSGGPCPDITLYDTCVAVDCPAPDIMLSGPNSLCLNAPNTVTLTATVNGSPGTGVWTGTGIVDGTAGLFDPTVSGSGQHIVTYTVDNNGCPFSETYLMTVFDSITANFVVDPLICITDIANLTYTGNASDGANYDYNFGGGIVVAGSGEGPYQLSYSSQGSKTIRLQVSENGCNSEFVTQTLDVVPTLTPPVVNCSPSTSDVNFTWTNNNPDGYIVNVLTGHVGTQISTTEYEFPGLIPGDEVIIEIISLNSGPCPIRKDTFSCIARNCPPVGITLTPVPDICLYPGTSALTLEAVVTGGAGVGDWSGPGIVDQVNGRFDPNVALQGAHLITYHYEDDGCDFNESLTINVYDPPTAFISNTSLVLTCSGGNVLTLDGSTSSGGNLTFEWTTSDGAFSVGAPTDQDQVEVGAPGTYQLKVIDATGCVDSTSVTVVQDANAPIADAGPDKVITCDSTLFTLGGNSTSGAGIEYEWTTTNGNIIGATDAITIDVDRTGTYTLKVINTTNGCETLDAAIVGIDTALASITLVAGDTIDCNTPVSGVSATLSADVSDYDLEWTTSDGTISGSTTGEDIDVTQGGTYTLTITNKTNGCTKSRAAIVAESDEIIDAVVVTKTDIICFGERNGTLSVTDVTGGIAPYTYVWSNGQNTVDLVNLGPGQYTLTVSDNNGCSFTEVFTIVEPIKVTADVGPNVTVAGGDSVTINLLTNLTTDAIGTIDWTGIDGVNCPGCPSLQFIATSTGTIIAMVTDTAGCSAIDSMKLTVIVPRIVFIPNVFSPNDDDRNEVFFIDGRPNLKNLTFMRIFDRWGNQLFEKTNITPGNETDGWDGTYREKPMLPGVYVFVTELVYDDGFKEVITGEVTLIR